MKWLRRKLIGDLEERVSRLEEIMDDKYSTMLSMIKDLQKELYCLANYYEKLESEIAWLRRDLVEMIERTVKLEEKIKKSVRA